MQEQPGSYVYRFDPTTHALDAVVTDILRLNGLTCSPDESILYVSDSSAFDLSDGAHQIRAYDAIDDRLLGNGRLFTQIDPVQPDGLWVDLTGNVFTSSEGSVQIYAPDGTRIGKILVPETVANLTFGGRDRDYLFIATGRSLYAIDLNTQGWH